MFQIKQPPSIIIGNNSCKNYKFKNNCLVITSPGTKNRGWLDHLGITNYHLFDKVEPNPSIETTTKIINEFSKMKDNIRIVNAARGGVIDEDALIEALNSSKVAAAALDVFVGEPSPRADILNHDKISLTPHVGAATVEAQERIGTELADKIISYYNK